MKVIKFLVLAMILFSITSVYAQNEIPVQEQNIYSSLSDNAIKNIVLNGSPKELKELLEKKIDVNIDYGCSTLLNLAIRSLVAIQNPTATPEDTLEKINMLIDAGADVNLATCSLTSLAQLTGLPIFAREIEKTFTETLMSNIGSSSDICHVNGVPKICKDTTPSEREKMKEEIHQIFQEERRKIEPYYTKIAEILLQHGADINKKSNGIAPIHFAANVPNNEKPILLIYLLEKGANPNVRDFQGSTPLFVANFADNIEAIDLLLKFGADPTIRNNKGILYKDFKTGELYYYTDY